MSLELNVKIQAENTVVCMAGLLSLKGHISSHFRDVISGGLGGLKPPNNFDDTKFLCKLYCVYKVRECININNHMVDY